MDPLNFFGEDIAPLILQHLSVRDLLKCTQVSSNWHSVIGSTSRVMSKVWLRFYEPLEGIECLMDSTRKYSNFKIQHGLPKKLVPLFEKYKWKNVMMRDDTDIDYKDLVAFLSTMAPTIETLDLWDIGTKNINVDLVHINFPRLKELELNLTNRTVLSLFLGSNPKLKKATLRDEGMYFQNVYQQIMEPANLIHEFLLRNQIEILKLLHCEWSFETDLTEGLTSKFKAITVTTSSQGCTATMQLNILKFIKSQPIRDLKASKEEINGGKRFLTVYYH